MAFDLGDTVPLSISLTDPTGAPANAGQVTVTITLPDGTTDVSSPISPTETGQYDYDYETVQAGRHNVRWVATGQNASAYSDAFDVTPADDGDFISLTDAKKHLKKNRVEADDDEKLRTFISAACTMITDRVGQVSPRTAVFDATRCRHTIVLPVRPVVAVTSVAKLPGLDAIPEADPAAGVEGWTLTSSEGVLTFTRWTGPVRVTYRAGRNPIPGNIRLAALELTLHLWRTSQMNQGGGRPGVGSGDQMVIPGASYALPYKVSELLGLGKNMRDEPLVG